MCARITSRPVGWTPNPAAVRHPPSDQLIRVRQERGTQVSRRVVRHASYETAWGEAVSLPGDTAGHLPARTRQLTSQAPERNFDMPAAALDLGRADVMMSPQKIAQALQVLAEGAI